MVMTFHPSDVVHDQIDMVNGYPANRADRVGDFALFTPLDETGEPSGSTPVQVVARVRVTARWIGGNDPERGNVAVVTIDDPDQGSALLLGTAWRVETWAYSGGDPTGSSWDWTCTYRLAVGAATHRPAWTEDDEFMSRPAWAELQGWSQTVGQAYGESRDRVEAPAWVIESWKASPLTPDPVATPAGPSTVPGWP